MGWYICERLTYQLSKHTKEWTHEWTIQRINWRKDARPTACMLIRIGYDRRNVTKTKVVQYLIRVKMFGCFSFSQSGPGQRPNQWKMISSYSFGKTFSVILVGIIWSEYSSYVLFHLSRTDKTCFYLRFCQWNVKFGNLLKIIAYPKF